MEKMSAEAKKWQAQMDAQTLMQAEQIRLDKSRATRAQSEAAKIARAATAASKKRGK